MELKFRNAVAGKYVAVTVEHDNTTIDLGLIDEAEATELLDSLREAQDELLDHFPTHPPHKQRRRRA